MGISRARPNFESFLSIIHKKGSVMKRLNSAFYLIIPGGPIIVIPAFSVQEVMKEQNICLNCKYFHQKEDWRDVPGGIYMPNGECRSSKPGKDGYPKLHAGNHCFKFKRMKEDASTRKCGK